MERWVLFAFLLLFLSSLGGSSVVKVIGIIIVGILWFSLKDLLGRLLEGLMGGNTSKEDPRRRSIPPSSLSSHNSGSYSHSYPGHGQQPYAPQPYPSHPLHTGQAHFPASSSQSSQAQTDVQRKKLQRTYSRIADNYKSLEQVTEALAEAGLESSNLIVGIDFTKSNEWTGRNSFQRRSLHHLGDTQNPYEQAISIIGRTLSSFDEDNLIPCFGFGDASTHDQDVFSFYPDERPCNGFEEALSRYRELVPHLRLAGPTSFAPIIEMAITIVEQSGGQYHVLLIIADGQVTRSVDTGSGQWSSQEQKTVDAIVQASHYPLSIVVVGVGDGPWDMMREFDDNIPSRSFDNFQFVNFTDIMLKNVSQTRRETEFALAALMEIPSQYKATLELGLLGHSTGKSPDRVSLPTPGVGYRMPTYNPKTTQSTSLKKSAPPYPRYDAPDPVTTATSAGETATFDNQVCPICLTNPKDMAFGCGHQTCCDCGQTLESCPICRCSIQTRIKLY